MPERISRNNDHIRIWPIYWVFMLEAVVLGQWIPRIPDIKQGLSLSDAELGLALLSLPLGTLALFPLAGRIVELIGLRSACRCFLPLWALVFITPALAGSLTTLMVALTLSGMAIGLLETAMNTKASDIEKAMNIRLMSKCHGFWSLGTMFGALGAGAVAQIGVEPDVHFLVILPILAVAGFIVASQLQGDRPSDKPVSTGWHSVLRQPGAWIHWPEKHLLLLCVMPVGVMMVEGAFIDWSAVFMSEVLSADPLIIATTYAFFSSIMALVRLLGDDLAGRFGDEKVACTSAILAAAGIALFSMADSVPQAIAGAAIAGAGAAIVFPLAVSAAASRPGGSPARNVASLNMIAFSAFLVAPPVIGFVSDAIGLRYALLLLTPLALLSAVLSGQLTRNN